MLRLPAVVLLVPTLLGFCVHCSVPAGEPGNAPKANKWVRKMVALKKRLQEGKVLFKESFDREDLSDKWLAEEGTWKRAKSDAGQGHGVVGSPGKKYPDSFFWTKESFKGDVVVEFDATCLSKPANDINFVICGKSPNYPPPESALYLFGLGGWGNTQSGVERAPKYKWKALTALFTIEPNKKYHILAARLGPYLHLFVDDRLVVSARDPSPLPAEGAFAFHVYNSTVRFENLVIRKPGKK